MQLNFTVKTLQHQNFLFAGTKGISQSSCRNGFTPGFYDRATGATYISKHADGSPASVHVLDGLPEKLVMSRTSSGQVASIKGTVVAGFISDGQFYTREQAAHMLA